MYRFKFGLEKVLDYRKMQEDEASCAFAQAMEHYENTKRRLAESVEELEENVDHRLEADNSCCVASNIHLFLYRDSMLEKINQLKVGLARASEVADEKRLELVEASKEYKILEKLKDRHYTDFIYREKVKDQKVQDELAKQVFLLQNHLERR